MKKVGRPLGHGDYYPQDLRDLLKQMDDCSKRHDMCGTCTMESECQRLYNKIGYSGKVKPKIKEDIEALLRVA